MPTEPVEPDETVEPVDPAIAALLAVINRVDGPKMQDMEPAEARAFFKKMVAVALTIANAVKPNAQPSIFRRNSGPTISNPNPAVIGMMPGFRPNCSRASVAR